MLLNLFLALLTGAHAQDCDWPSRWGHPPYRPSKEEIKACLKLQQSEDIKSNIEPSEEDKEE